MRPEKIAHLLTAEEAFGLSPTEIAEYQKAGVSSVWVLDPSRNEARIFRRGAPARIVGAADRLSDPDVLPGLALNVASLFSV